MLSAQIPFEQTPFEKTFEPGQLWQYHTRPQEPQSTLIVCKVETHPQMGNIIHIHIQGLRVKNPRAASGIIEYIHHMPISEQALAQSVTQRVRTGEPLPDFEEGYRMWQEDKGGVFTFPVDKCVDFIQSSLSPTAV